MPRAQGRHDRLDGNGDSNASIPTPQPVLPRIEVDPETCTVRIDGEVVEPHPVAELPMAQRYFLF